MRKEGDPMGKKGLGKGLDSLLPEDFYEEIEPQKTADPTAASELKITQLEPDPEQPRKDFDPEKLEALAQSIRIHGVIQPLIVSETKNGFYRIIAGERRWRAAKLAGLETVPAVIRECSDQQAAEMALVENLQRDDLNAIEEAKGYQTLMTRFSFTQQQIADRVGKSRPAVANALRLLHLPESVQDMVIYGELSGGHARALSALDQPDLQKDLAQKIIAQDLNVRQTEAMIAALNQPKKPKNKIPVDLVMKSQLEQVEKGLQSYLGTKVTLIQGKKKGKIEIDYYSQEELERLIGLIEK